MSDLSNLVINTVTGFILIPPRVDKTKDYILLNWQMSVGNFVVYVYDKPDFYLEWSFFFNEGSVIDGIFNNIEQLIYTVKNSSFVLDK